MFWLQNASYISLLEEAPAIPQLCLVPQNSVLLPCSSTPGAFSGSGEYANSVSLLYVKNAIKCGKLNLNSRTK